MSRQPGRVLSFGVPSVQERFNEHNDGFGSLLFTARLLDISPVGAQSNDIVQEAAEPEQHTD